jgi:hypothetical protein
MRSTWSWFSDAVFSTICRGSVYLSDIPWRRRWKSRRVLSSLLAFSAEHGGEAAWFIHGKGKIWNGAGLGLWRLSLFVGVLGRGYLAGIYLDVKKSFMLLG